MYASTFYCNHTRLKLKTTYPVFPGSFGKFQRSVKIDRYFTDAPSSRQTRVKEERDSSRLRSKLHSKSRKKTWKSSWESTRSTRGISNGCWLSLVFGRTFILSSRRSSRILPSVQLPWRSWARLIFAYIILLMSWSWRRAWAWCSVSFRLLWRWLSKSISENILSSLNTFSLLALIIGREL